MENHEENDVDLTEADVEEIVSDLTDADLRELSGSLDDAQTYWERMAGLQQPKIPCPECTGAGGIPGGSLGNACPTCAGARVFPHPDWDGIEAPDFSTMRKAITDYRAALADRALPPDATCSTCGGSGRGGAAGQACPTCSGSGRMPHPGHRGLALPPASTLPTRAAIDEIIRAGKKLLSQLPAPAAAPALPDYKPARGLMADNGDLGDYSDDELDELEDEPGISDV